MMSLMDSDEGVNKDNDKDDVKDGWLATKMMKLMNKLNNATKALMVMDNCNDGWKRRQR